MPVIFSEAETVGEIANRILPAAHPHLATARIRYVYRDKASKEGGKPLAGKVTKISGVNEYLLNCDFLIVVAQDMWNEMDAHTREALVDHLLTYCQGEEDEKDPGAPMKWSLRKPDVKEFVEVLNRRGKWNESLGEFVDAANMLSSAGSGGGRGSEEYEEEDTSELSGLIGVVTGGHA